MKRIILLIKKFAVNNFYISLFIVFTGIFWANGFALAQMEAIDDAGLASVFGGRSFTVFAKDISFDYEFDQYAYTDTDTGNKLELNLVVFHDGAGGPVFCDSGDEPMTFDIFTISDPLSPADGRTYFGINIPEWHQDYHIAVENLVFCGTDLGSFDIGNCNKPSTSFYFSGHGTGLDYQINFQKDFEQTRYTFNTAGDFIGSDGIYFAQSVSGAPESPGTWIFDGSFAVGDILNANPATMDVITPVTTGVTSIVTNLPIKGAIRIQDIQFSGNDFGPCALDGINVHHLYIMVKPGIL